MSQAVEIVLKAFGNQGSNWLQDITIRPGQRKSIGRGQGKADFPFPSDPHLSTIHFEIDYTGDAPLLRDRGSTNGTFLNGTRVVSKQKLNSGETIHAGCISFRVENLQPRQLIAATIDVVPSENQAAEPVASSPISAKSDHQSADKPISVGPSSVITPLSPIWDSTPEVIPNPSAPEPVASPVTPPVTEVTSYRLWRRKFSADIEKGLSIVLEKLSQKWSIQVVVHPKKIRQEQLTGANIIPLWSWNSQMADFGPVAMPWKEFQNYRSFMTRYIAADALVVFIGYDAQAVQGRLINLATCGVHGYSEPNGFLSCFWPSSLTTMLDAGREQARQELLSDDIAGLVIASPWNPISILAAGSEQLEPSMKECEFRQVSHWYASH